MFFWSPSIEILSRIMYEAAAAARTRLIDVGWGWGGVAGGGGRAG